jgi:predicted hotdog family 3-hydroxylacyl-ACP dehydratase
MVEVDRAVIEQLIPHRGSMALLERAVYWDASCIDAVALSHLDPAHPLRSHGQLRAVHLCEYGAQAAALHGGLVAREAGAVAAPGYLVSLRDVSLSCGRIDDLAGTLEIHAELLLQDAASWQYLFTASHQGARLAGGRLAIIRRK